MKKITIVLLALLIMNQKGYSAIRVPNIIGSHMVLQQKSDVKIWGWGAPGENVTIHTNWDTTTYTATTQSSAKWILTIKTPAAGGPYTITIKGNNEIVLEDVLIGEVWVCSGQSNMEWSADQGLTESKEEAPNANNKNIRLFYVSKSTSEYPQENVDGHWMVCSPEEMIHFSAIGYFYGKNLEAALHTPIGLINSNWGGTPAETWTPKEIVMQSDALIEAAKKQNVTPWWSHRIGDTFNAMIAPLTNFSIAGVIWYQGESNTGTYYTYEELFTKMIGSWRAKWNANFPFYFVQIAPFHYEANNIGALLRETQTGSSQYPNTGMVVVSDLVPDTNNIHPTLKKEVANRLAKLALKKTYKKIETVVEGPQYVSHHIEKDKIAIELNNIGSGLICKDKELSNFEIAAEDRVFYPAVAKIVADKIIVSNKNISKPVAVRYAFKNTAIGNVFNKEGLPLNLFRTDAWTMDTSKL
jgi:sialate O-acetylesterase